LARIEKEREQRFKEYEEKLNALVSENKAHTDTVNKYTQRLGVLEGQLHEVKSRVHLNAFAWVFIVIAILFAFFLGWLM
jgi:hypothetical protein